MAGLRYALRVTGKYRKGAEMLKAIAKIVGSQKSILLAVGAMTNVIADLFGIDITQPAMLVVDSAFVLLVVIQGMLDMRWGSQSDGTGEFEGQA